MFSLVLYLFSLMILVVSYVVYFKFRDASINNANTNPYLDEEKDCVRKGQKGTKGNEE